jgi:transposase-like protein
LRSPFDDDGAARETLEAIRWPDGPSCPRCASRDPDVFRIGGEKHSHRDGLYQCRPCRRQFSVTVGTVLERLRLPLSTLIRAVHAFSYEGPAYGKEGKPPLTQLETEIGVSYRTVLRMRDVIKSAASKYRGYKTGFGAWPRSLMEHKSNPPLTAAYQRRKHRLLEKGRHPSQHAIRATGVLADRVSGRGGTRAAFDRTGQLLRLLLAPAKPVAGKGRFRVQGGVPAKHLTEIAKQ